MTNPEFLTKIKNIYENIRCLSHRKKSDSTYYRAQELANELTFLLKGNDFKKDADILNKYNLRDSDKGKEQIINEFKDEAMTDLEFIIRRNEKPFDTTS